MASCPTWDGSNSWDKMASCPTWDGSNSWDKMASCPTWDGSNSWDKMASCPTWDGSNSWDKMASCPTANMTNLDFKGSYQRHLPHIQPPGATFFITTRLAGSLPSYVMERLARETAEIQSKYADDPELADIEGERYWFRQYEAALHESKTGPFWLRENRVATMLAEGLHFNDRLLYCLDAFCIMPNHLHVVFMPLPTTLIEQGTILSQDAEGNVGYLKPGDDGRRQFVRLEYFSLARIMHRLKRRIAREGNKLLARTGEFWEHESYDRWIRNDEERKRIIAYVRNNPVTTGLVKDWSEWRWTYVRDPER